MKSSVFVLLLTADGVLVQEVEMPVFAPMPSVVLFGTRVFKRITDRTYHECFAYAVPPATPKPEGL